uniref:hypothetical protein n=1 Tax=Ningiella ruwaisensis TaxID=2364274 RepID=UPI0010A083A9|nr:hypothetical protein [Ningiella ruwaisensis]
MKKFPSLMLAFVLSSMTIAAYAQESWYDRAVRVFGLDKEVSQDGQTDPKNAPDISNDVVTDKSAQDAPELTTQYTQAKQIADYQHVLYAYFQQQYDEVLMLIARGDKRHGFMQLSIDDSDRLRLMQGAAQLNLGLYKSSQTLFLGLLSRTSSPYVQANTWYWLAKAGFDNQQFYLAQRAFAAIEQDELASYISDAQMQELIYLNTYILMMQNKDFASMLSRLDEAEIYPAYVYANLGTLAFNQALDRAVSQSSSQVSAQVSAQVSSKEHLAQAVDFFVKAKQALLTHQRIQNAWYTKAATAGKRLIQFDWFSLDIIKPWTWFSSDENSHAQGKLAEAQSRALIDEQNALFDRINLGLAYTLLQQQDDENALAVINTVSSEGGEAGQALLSAGWALAKQNRWLQAIKVWEHLQSQSKGLYSLQASYGVAYALGQQGKLGEAFYALDDTSRQITTNLAELSAFSMAVEQNDFFDAYQKNDALFSDWPEPLLDIKRLFFANHPDIDTRYLLEMRASAKQMLNNLADKEKKIATLAQMLDVRKARFAQRQASLDLQKAQASIASAKEQLLQIQTQLERAFVDTLIDEDEASKGANSQARLNNGAALSELDKRMASPEYLAHLTRLEQAQARLSRLLNEQSRNPEQKRPIKPSYAERLARIQGIIYFEMSKDKIAQTWAHKQQLKDAKQAVENAQLQLDALLRRQQDANLFTSQQMRLDALNTRLMSQRDAALVLYNKADKALRTHLLDIVDTRMAQLAEQEVNTRLAKLRLQDLVADSDMADSDIPELNKNSDAQVNSGGLH